MRGGDAEHIQSLVSAELEEKRYILQIEVELVHRLFFSLVLTLDPCLRRICASRCVALVQHNALLGSWVVQQANSHIYILIPPRKAEAWEISLFGISNDLDIDHSSQIS